LTSGIIRHFTSSSGLPPADTEALYRDRQGAIWFCSTRGLARYRPEPDRDVPLHPPLLTSLVVKASRYPISALGESELRGLQLRPGQDTLAVTYRTPNFDPNQDVSYQYRMDGPWSQATELESVQYAQLRPGKHRFEVRSVNDAGRVSAPATLEFQLFPPFWQQGWFLVLVAFFIGLAAYALHRIRLAQVLAVEGCAPAIGYRSSR
jgi:hypothetical protein